MQCSISKTVGRGGRDGGQVKAGLLVVAVFLGGVVRPQTSMTSFCQASPVRLSQWFHFVPSVFETIHVKIVENFSVKGSILGKYYIVIFFNVF